MNIENALGVSEPRAPVIESELCLPLVQVWRLPSCAAGDEEDAPP
jgi:hypothetical protein